MSNADFEKWCGPEVECWTVGDAAMLLLGLEPTGEFPPWFDPEKPQLNMLYHDIFAAAQSDLGGKLPTKWEKYSEVLPATRANAAYVYVLRGDWIDWARRRKFSIPPALQAAASRFKRTPQLQRQRQEQLEDLLNKIEASAGRIDRDFGRKKMPGTKDQFKRVIKAHCPAALNQRQDCKGKTGWTI